MTYWQGLLGTKWGLKIMSKFTKWYSTKNLEYPHRDRIGVYQVRLYIGGFNQIIESHWYAYWNGKTFGKITAQSDDALRYPTSKVRRDIFWRGLA